jgi:hypothetical protein
MGGVSDRTTGKRQSPRFRELYGEPNVRQRDERIRVKTRIAADSTKRSVARRQYRLVPGRRHSAANGGVYHCRSSRYRKRDGHGRKGQVHPGRAERDHVARSRLEHDTRADGPFDPAQARLSLSAARASIARQTGPDFSLEARSSLRARLLLAQTSRL